MANEKEIQAGTEPKFKIGQLVFYVPRNPREQGPGSLGVVITKIGRKWITFKGSENGYENRFDKETLLVDAGNYSSPGMIYLSDEEYQEQREKERIWNRLRDVISGVYKCPGYVSKAELIQIANILRIKVE